MKKKLNFYLDIVSEIVRKKSNIVFSKTNDIIVKIHFNNKEDKKIFYDEYGEKSNETLIVDNKSGCYIVKDVEITFIKEDFIYFKKHFRAGMFKSISIEVTYELRFSEGLKYEFS